MPKPASWDSMGALDFQPRMAHPVQAPPSADALSTTGDLFFEIDNRDGSLRPGQRVGAALSLRGQQESLVIPSQAVLYDIFGGTWVYVRMEPQSFERRRVLVRYTEADRAILAEGPAEGAEIVLDGAAELFGTEFGAGK